MGFWQRQFRGPRTRGSDVFDFVFGIALPLVCFWRDPGVMFGKLALSPVPNAPLFVYGVSGLAMAAMAAWLVIGGRWRTLDSVLAGVLFAGAALALLVGLCLLPVSILLLLALIGFLGLVPLFTAFACLRSSMRALAGRSFRSAVPAAVAVFALTAGYQVAADRMLDRAVDDFIQSPDPGVRAQAALRLERWRVLVPRQEFARRGNALLAAEDPRGDRYEVAYEQITGLPLDLGAAD